MTTGTYTPTAATGYETTTTPTATATHTTTTTTTTGVEGMAEPTTAVCGSEAYTKVEDRERVIERSEYEKVHRPVEKEFVVETKFVGERELPEKRTTEVLGQETRVVAEAAPKGACE